MTRPCRYRSTSVRNRFLKACLEDLLCDVPAIGLTETIVRLPGLMTGDSELVLVVLPEGVGVGCLNISPMLFGGKGRDQSEDEVVSILVLLLLVGEVSMTTSGSSQDCMESS